MQVRRTTAAVAAAMAVAAGPAAGAVTEDAVVDVRRVALASGGVGLVSYELDRTFTSAVSRPAGLPQVTIPRGEAFRGAFGDSTFMAAWLAPDGKRQFTFDGEIVEDAHLLTGLAGDAVPLAAGERYRSAFALSPFDAPLDWERERGEADGALQWDAAVDVRRISGSRDGLDTTTSDVLFVRADLVARGGDVDARRAPVAAPPLVIDLPRSYPQGTTGSYRFTVSLPYTTYVSGISATVDPEAGTATLQSGVKGWLPEGREFTTAGGTEIKEWHLPITGMIVLGEQAPLIPSTPQVGLPKGGLITVGDSTGRSAQTVQGPSGDASAASSSTQELADAAAVSSRTLTAPRTIRTGDGGHVLTLDPDFRRSGALAFTDIVRAATGTRFADALSVPFVRIAGEVVRLPASSLSDLRVYPHLRIAQIGWTSFGALDPARPLHDAGFVQASAFDDGLRIDAYYALPDGREVQVNLQGRSADSGPGEITSAARVRFRDGNVVPASPAVHLELPPGDVTLDGAARGDEFSAPIADDAPLRVGDRTFLPVGAPATVAVTRAGDAPSAEPRVRGRSLAGRNVTVTYVAGKAASSMRLQLDRDGTAPPAAPKPIGTRCGEPEVVDPAGDAPAGLDVRRAWLENDAANLYATIELDSLPKAALPETELSWIGHVRSDHSGHYVRAWLDDAGAWRFGHGPNNIENSGPTYFALYPATGEVQGNLIRIALPRSAFRGSLVRDVSARSVLRTPAAVREPDVAPDGSTRVHGLGGEYRLGDCG